MFPLLFVTLRPNDSTPLEEIPHWGKYLYLHFLLLFLVSFIGLCVYRIYWHPLSRFPGSTWAKIGEYWLCYWDIWKGGGVVKEIERLHEVHGPIIRIGPNELHISDSASYAKIYKPNTPLTKSKPFYAAFGLSHTIFSEFSPHLHKIRRSLLSPIFDRKAMSRFSPAVIVPHLNLLLDTIKVHKRVDLFWGFRAFTGDNISAACFGESLGMLAGGMHDGIWKKEGGFLRAYEGGSEMTLIFRHFQLLRKILVDWCPFWLVGSMKAELKGWGELEKICYDQVRRSQSHYEVDVSYLTAFGRLLTPDCVKGHRIPSAKELVDEAFDLLTAGVDTSAAVLTRAVYEILRNPRMEEKLLEELKTVMPNATSMVEFKVLEGLPYFSAILKEALRITCSLPGRLPRVLPKNGQGMIICGEYIPPGTTVGMSVYQMHFNRAVFKRPELFIPDRWLDAGEDEKKKMEEAWVPFSKGTRGCVAIGMAQYQTALALAHLFRRFEMKLDETVTPEGMEWVDAFTVKLLSRSLFVEAIERSE